MRCSLEGGHVNAWAGGQILRCEFGLKKKRSELRLIKKMQNAIRDGSAFAARSKRTTLSNMWGLATSERRGREVVYRITDPRVRQVLELAS